MVLHEVRLMLKEMPNIRHATTNGPGQQITVVGDLHGKLDDLLTIFYKVIQCFYKWSRPVRKHKSLFYNLEYIINN
jgi:hypothetical protein